MKSGTDVAALALYILGAVSGLAQQAISLGLSDALDAVLPQNSKAIMGTISIVSICAGLIVRLFKNQTPENSSTIATATGGTVEIKTVAPPTP